MARKTDEKCAKAKAVTRGTTHGGIDKAADLTAATHVVIAVTAAMHMAVTEPTAFKRERPAEPRYSVALTLFASINAYNSIRNNNRSGTALQLRLSHFLTVCRRFAEHTGLC